MMRAGGSVGRFGSVLAGFGVVAVGALAAARGASAGVSHALAFGTPGANVNCGVVAVPPTIPEKALLCTAPSGYIELPVAGSANKPSAAARPTRRSSPPHRWGSATASSPTVSLP